MDTRKAELTCNDMREVLRKLANDGVDSPEPPLVAYWEALADISAAIRRVEIAAGVHS